MGANPWRLGYPYITNLSPTVLRRPLSSLVDLLAAIPSVVYGFWGVFALIPALGPIGRGSTSVSGIPLIGWLFQGPFFGYSVFAAGVVIANESPKQTSAVSVRRVVGMVFQRPNPFPTMSIRDNMVARLKLQGAQRKKSLSLRGANLWNEVKDRLDTPGGGLSGGQQQRLCIARAIALSPDVLLMDEPCSALDPISTLAIEDLIAELKQQYTIVIVTHNMQQAARVSDQTAFFNLEATGKPGRLVEINSTEKVFSSPDQKCTEDYVSGRFG